MSKTAFLFPGQGSQRVGMGADLLAVRPDLFEPHMERAGAASGLPIRELCLEGPMEELTRTDVAQPALFAFSLAMLDLAREEGLRPDFVAGHSLGEYTAAVASGAVGAEDGMRLVVRARAADGGCAVGAAGRDGGDHRSRSRAGRGALQRGGRGGDRGARELQHAHADHRLRRGGRGDAADRPRQRRRARKRRSVCAWAPPSTAS